MQLARLHFNNWLHSDSLFDSNESTLPLPYQIVKTNLENHPLIAYHRQKESLAAAKAEAVKSQLLPQIQTGFQLQSVMETSCFMVIN